MKDSTDHCVVGYGVLTRKTYEVQTMAILSKKTRCAFKFAFKHNVRTHLVHSNFSIRIYSQVVLCMDEVVW